MTDPRSAIAYQLGSLMVANAEAAAEVATRDLRIAELEAQIAHLQAAIAAMTSPAAAAATEAPAKP